MSMLFLSLRKSAIGAYSYINHSEGVAVLVAGAFVKATLLQH